MSSIHRLGWIVPLVLAVSARAGEPENWDRLRAMPLQQRQALSEKLQQFDRLPQAERQAIRSLDERVTQSENRDQYQSVLRRYHLWLETLPEDQRQQLKEAPPDQRSSLIQLFLAKQPVKDAKAPRSLFLQIADYGGISPFELGRRLQVWFALAPNTRTKYAALAGKAWRDKMGELGSEMKIKPLPHPSEADEEKLFNQLATTAHGRADLSQLLKRIEETTGSKDEPKAKLKFQFREMRLRLAENYYFLLHKPENVTGSNLLAFEKALPVWIRRLYDHLPPEEARRRLTVLYRLVFPPPKEISKAEPAAAAASNTQAVPPNRPSEPKAPAPAASPNPAGPF